VFFNDLTLLIGEAIELGLIDISHVSDIYDKCFHTKQQLQRIKTRTLNRFLKSSEYKPPTAIKWAIGVEDFLNTFSMGFPTSGKTLTNVAMLNCITSYECLNIFNERPFSIHPISMKSYFGFTQKLVNEPMKVVVWEYVSQRVPKFPWSKNRSGKLKDLNYDIANAYILALYSIKKYREEKLFQNNEKMQYYKEFFQAKVGVDKILADESKIVESSSDSSSQLRTHRKNFGKKIEEKVCNLIEKLSKELTVPDGISALDSIKEPTK